MVTPNPTLRRDAPKAARPLTRRYSSRGNNKMEGCVTNWIMVILTGITAFFTYLVRKVYARMA